MFYVNTAYDFPFIQLVGEGENLIGGKLRAFLSESALAEYNKVKNELLSENNEEAVKNFINSLELHMIKKLYVLTKKKDDKIVTLEDYIKASLGGTTGIKELSSSRVRIAGVAGYDKIGEHSQILVTIPKGEWLIMFTTGRYKAGYIVYKNNNGLLEKNGFFNEGEYVDLPPLNGVKILTDIALPK